MSNNDQTETDEQADESTSILTSTSRRAFVGSAAVGVSALALGTTYAVTTDGVAIVADLADEQLEPGGSTTATFSVKNSPEGSAGTSIEVALDSEVAEITGVELGEYAPPGLEDRINEDIEDAGGAVSSIDAQSFDPQGIEDTEYELATFQLETKDVQATTDISLVDVTINNPDGDQIEDPDYDVPTLTVGDGGEEPPETPTVTAALADEQLDPGDTTTLKVGLNEAPNGITGYRIHVDVDPDVVTVADAEIGSTFEDTMFPDVEVTDDRATIEAVKEIDAGTTNLELAVVDLEAAAEGTSVVEVSDSMTLPIEDGDGEPVEPNFESAELTVGDGDAGDEQPVVPEGLEVTATSTDSIEVDWSEDPNATGYTVSLDGEQQAQPGTTGYTFDGLEPDTSYEIAVTALGEDGFETDPATLQASTDEEEGTDPEQPTVTASLADAQLDPGESTTATVGLNEAPNGLSGYQISVSVDPDVATITDAEIGDTFEDTSFPDVEVTDEQATIEAVKEIDAGATDLELAVVDLEAAADGETVVEVDESETLPIENADGEPVGPAFQSPTLTVGDGKPDDEPPAVPEGLEVVSTDQTSIEVDWRAGPNAARYAVFLDGTRKAEPGTTGYTFEGLTANTTYEIAVRAIGDDGQESDPATIEASTGTEPPAVPDGLEVVSTSQTSIEVDWNEDPNAAQFAVYLDGSRQTETGTTGYTFDGLEPDTTYEIAVKAVAEDGSETDPATVEASTGNEPPSVPDGLSVVSTSQNSIEVDWDEDPNAARYAVYLDGARKAEPGTTGYTFDGLEPDTTYEVAVKAIAEDGSETDPASIEATTDADDDDGEEEYPDWDPETTYRSGDRVHYDGQNWEAQWYNVDTEPSHEPFTAWKAISGDLPEPDSPHAELDPSATEVSVGERVEFDVIDTTDSDHWITDLHWEFGDGTTASGWWNSHTYESSGTYTVTLTATDQRGRDTTHEVEITVE